MKKIEDYQKNYSDSAFWKKAKSLGRVVLRPAVLLYCIMKSSDVPFGVKATVAGALGYLILPADLIPDFIPFTGYTDDAAALLAVIKMCGQYVTPELKARAEKIIQKLLSTES